MVNEDTVVSTLLEIQPDRSVPGPEPVLIMFQPFLRFNVDSCFVDVCADKECTFQPFLRFNGSCVWLLWVFKFFFGFLSSRRSV